jgi:Ca2+-binding EF-hand superfamily protein
MEQKISEKKLKKIMAELDKDNSNEIDFNEFIEIMKSQLQVYPDIYEEPITPENKERAVFDTFD